MIDGDDILGDGVNIAARLEGLCEPGDVLISGSAFEHVRGKIEADFIDIGEKELKNIARPVRVYALGTGLQDAAPRPSAAETLRERPPRLSIVVLPFSNLSGDPKQEYFVDGVTESLTTDLSRMRGSFVIARNTAFAYKGKAVDVKQVGRELNVRYVLEGSVQRSGKNMRVSVQLIDAENGNHLWAERFDKPVSNLFKMQDEIIARIANALTAQFASAEARRGARSPHPDAIDLHFQGLACMYKGMTPDNYGEARRLFEIGLTQFPDSFELLIAKAVVDVTIVANFFPADRIERLAAAEAAANKAMSIAPDHAWSHLTLGIVYMQTNRAVEGVAKCERALELDRNLVGAHAYLGALKARLGRAEEAEAHVNEAVRLSPLDALFYIWATIAGAAKLVLGKDAEAASWLRRAVDANANYPTSHFLLAAALARLGRTSEAQSELRLGLAVYPTFTIAKYRAGLTSDNPTYLEGVELIIDGLRKAGAAEA